MVYTRLSMAFRVVLTRPKYITEFMTRLLAIKQIGHDFVRQQLISHPIHLCGDEEEH